MESNGVCGTAKPNRSKPVIWDNRLHSLIVTDRRDPDQWDYASPADEIAGRESLIAHQRDTVAGFKATARMLLCHARFARLSGNARHFDQHFSDACRLLRQAVVVANQVRLNSQALARLRGPA